MEDQGRKFSQHLIREWRMIKNAIMAMISVLNFIEFQLKNGRFIIFGNICCCLNLINSCNVMLHAFSYVQTVKNMR